MKRQRIQQQPEKVISVRGRIVFSREDKSITNNIIKKQQETKDYQKRHDDFMAIGGTKKLLDYSNNVAKQISQFKLSRNII